MRARALLLALTLPLVTGAPLPAFAADPSVQLIRVFPGKVRYLRGETGGIRVTLKNIGLTAEVVTVEGGLTQELARVTALAPRQVTLPAGKEVTATLPFTAPDHDYGCEAQVRVRQGDTLLAQGRDMFAVADDLWKIANGAGGIDIMTMSGFGFVNPAKDLQTARDHYYTWWEKMFWPPDDFGDMTPPTEAWFSGQGGRYETKRVIKAFMGMAKANGIASVTYGKGTAGGPAGWELARRHPDWFTQDMLGRPVGIYDTAVFARWDSPVGEAFPKTERFDRGWWYLYPDLRRLDTLDWGIDQLIKSTEEYGWDGVRFDGGFTYNSGNDEVATRNLRRMKERIWAKYPHFAFGENYSYTLSNPDPAAISHSTRELITAGGHYMQEGIRQWMYASNGRYKTYRDYWQRESASADILRQIGATYHFIYDARATVAGQYKFVLGTVAGAHPVYGDSAVAPGCANWGRFLARWSAYVWDVNLRNLPDTEVQVGGNLWTAGKARVVDAKTAATVVHLIVPPTQDEVQAPDVALGPPAANVLVRVHLPARDQVLRAAAIAPEQPDEPLLLPVAREGEWASVTVPEVKSWTMVVFERAGTFTVPTYARFTERPDPAQVKAGVESGVSRLIRDPLRPDLPAPAEGNPVRVLEMENLYQTQAQVEPDPDASGGACARIDYTMTNSTVISHAIFGNVTPGHYRATYRLKLKSKTDAAGKAIWAGFGLYVSLGAKQVWLKEIGPDDFATPGKYQDFAVEFDFLGEGSAINVAAFWRGQQAGGTVYADKVTLEQLAAFSDADLAAKLKYVPRIDLTPGGTPGLDALVVNGLYSDLHRLPEALPPPARVTCATVQVGENAAALTGYPKTYEELCAYDVVVLVNADASWLGFPGRAALRDFVKAGGGLLVLGGNYSLGQGGFASTFLSDLLPVSVAPARDVQPVSPPLALRPAPSGLARALPASLWKVPPVLYWRHRVALKPEAQTHLLAGSESVLVTGAYGRGRVAVFSGTVLGQPAGKEQPFWSWAGWPPLMRNTVGWLARTEPEGRDGGG